MCATSLSSARHQLSCVPIPLPSQWCKDRHQRYKFSLKKGWILPLHQEGLVAAPKGDPWLCLESKPMAKLIRSAGAGTWKCQQGLKMNRMDGRGQFRSHHHTDQKGGPIPGTFHGSVPRPKGNQRSSTGSSKPLLSTISTGCGRRLSRSPHIKPIPRSHRIVYFFLDGVYRPSNNKIGVNPVTFSFRQRGVGSRRTR